MLALQVATPSARELEFLAALAKDTDTLGVVKPYKVASNNTTEALDKFLVEHIIEELQVAHTVVECVLNAVFDKLLSQRHIVLQVVERHLGLNHPELCQVAGSIGVLGTEGGTKGVNLTKRESTQLTLQLTRHGQCSLASKEVLRVINLTVLALGHIVQVESCNIEHSTCALAVRSGNQRGVPIVEALVVEELMNCVCHSVADTEHSTKGVGAGAEIGNLAEELHRVTLLLQGVVAICLTVNLNLFCLHLHGLTRAYRLNKRTLHAKASTCGNLLQESLVGSCHIHNYLNVVNGRAVIEGDERHILVAAFCAHPTLHNNLLTLGLGGEQINDSYCHK